MQTYITHNLQIPTSGAQTKHNSASKLACKAQFVLWLYSATARHEHEEKRNANGHRGRKRKKEKGAQTKHNSACKLACKAQLCFGCIARQHAMSMERSGMRMKPREEEKEKKPKYKLRCYGFFFYRTDV